MSQRRLSLSTGFQADRKCVEASDDVINDDFTSSADSRKLGLRSYIRLSAVLVKMPWITLTFVRRFRYAHENTNCTLWHRDLFRSQLFHHNACRDNSI